MRKFLKRIVLLFLGLVLCNYSFCYADMITIKTNNFNMGRVLIPVGIVVLFILIISYISLIITAKKDKNTEVVNEDIQNKINDNRKYIYICLSVLTITFSISISILKNTYPKDWLILICILLILSIIYRAKEKKVITYILYFAAVIIVICTNIYVIKPEEEYNKKLEEIKILRQYGFRNESELEEFNENFTPYLGSNIPGSQVNALIQKSISINNIAIREKDTVKTIKLIYNNGEKNEVMEVIDNKLNRGIIRVNPVKYYEVKEEYNVIGKITQIIIKQI